jgi:hypothetical protein
MRRVLAMVALALAGVGCTTSETQIPEAKPATPVQIRVCVEDERQFYNNGHCVHIDALTKRALEQAVW